MRPTNVPEPQAAHVARGTAGQAFNVKLASMVIITALSFLGGMQYTKVFASEPTMAVVEQEGKVTVTPCKLVGRAPNGAGKWDCTS